LTFGLTGKQKVKEVQARCDLMRLLNSLPRNHGTLPREQIRSTPLDPEHGIAGGEIGQVGKAPEFAILDCIF
jgi:hypothetical protein